jgi:hypothetical protein
VQRACARCVRMRLPAFHLHQHGGWRRWTATCSTGAPVSGGVASCQSTRIVKGLTVRLLPSARRGTMVATPSFWERVKMSDVLALAQIEERFQSEWVLVGGSANYRNPRDREWRRPLAQQGPGRGVSQGGGAPAQTVRRALYRKNAREHRGCPVTFPFDARYRLNAPIACPRVRGPLGDLGGTAHTRPAQRPHGNAAETGRPQRFAALTATARTHTCPWPRHRRCDKPRAPRPGHSGV